jgi:hypothetical protein
MGFMNERDAAKWTYGPPFKAVQFPPQHDLYDVALCFRGDLVADAEHGRVVLKGGAVIMPAIESRVMTEQLSRQHGLGRVFDHVTLTLRDVRLIVLARNDLENVERLQFSDGTTVDTDWLSAIVFMRPQDEGPAAR